MLLAITFSSAETVMGLLRDGSVHHETMASAASHSVLTGGEHGHEDGVPHGTEHQHGTPADHCTHQHGTFFTPRPLGLGMLVYSLPEAFLEPPFWLDRFSEPSFRPPQA